MFGALCAAFDGLHGFCDTWLQKPQDAINKGRHGDELIYPSDGNSTTEVAAREDERPCSATALGRRAVSRHVASYLAAQAIATIGVTRAVGYRVPVGALVAGAVINGGTHWVIDRRKPLLWLAKRVNHKDGYIDYATVQRKPGAKADTSGPGTALYELDQALHRGLGVVAAAVTASLAVRIKSRESR